MGETSNLGAYFGALPDPWGIGRCEHKRVDIILMAMWAA